MDNEHFSATDVKCCHSNQIMYDIIYVNLQDLKMAWIVKEY